jgi:hypothetical protein
VSSYSVEWNREAEDELAQIWLRATNRTRINVAQVAIDCLLETDPHGNGIYLSEGLYQLSVPPLRVFYEIIESEKQVNVTDVFQII